MQNKPIRTVRNKANRTVQNKAKPIVRRFNSSAFAAMESTQLAFPS